MKNSPSNQPPSLHVSLSPSKKNKEQAGVSFVLILVAH